ncbi:MAG: hypothetical protein P1V81_05815 [Planctomycetota bacterium]|nr:hypothetical protein [Planctomycetota bacterium]
MPTDSPRRSEPSSKAQLAAALAAWLETSDAPTLDSGAKDGRTPWAYVRSGTGLFVLHSDTKREAVQRYLQLVAEHGDDIAWTIGPSTRGNWTTVRYGPSEELLRAFYLYVA